MTKNQFKKLALGQPNPEQYIRNAVLHRMGRSMISNLPSTEDMYEVLEEFIIEGILLGHEERTRGRDNSDINCRSNTERCE